jgi:hypothetical protein
MAKRSNLPAVAGILGAVVFGALLLALVLWPKSGVSPIPIVLPNVLGDPDQAKVLALLRDESHVPRPQIEVAKWIPAQQLDLDAPRRICWIEYRIDLGGSWGWRKSSSYYDVTGSKANVFKWGEWQDHVAAPRSPADADWQTYTAAKKAMLMKWKGECERAFPDHNEFD